MTRQHKRVVPEQTLRLLSRCFQSCSEKQSGQLAPNLAASVALRGCNLLLPGSVNTLLPPRQAGVGPACWLLPIHCLLCPSLVIGPLSLPVPLPVPCGPLYFPSVTVLSPHPSVLFRVRHHPKGFVLESCSLVQSGTYSLTPLARRQPVSLSHLHEHKQILTQSENRP